ncbi:MAG: alpha/beta hydrolase [Actinobacteria bacterium]|nr:alpha/beta hydrolase [Actinomycetota bacterium]
MARKVMLALALIPAALWVAPPAHAEGFRVRRGLTYARPEGFRLRLDAYLPAQPGARPAVILLHGGSWSEGSRADLAGIGRAFAAEGFVAFSIDYRLAPAHPFPAALRDAQTAVRWVRRHAARFGVAPRRMAAFGVSAGGHLAAMLAVAGRGTLDRGPRVRAAAAWSGPMDLSSLASDAPPYAGAWLEYHVRRFLGCAPASCPGPARAASPLTHVDPSDGAMLIASSTDELVGLDQAEVMDEALARQGVPHRVLEVAGTRHASFFAADDERSLQTGWSATVGFLRAWTSTPRAADATAPLRSVVDPGRTASGIAAFLAVVGLGLFPGWVRRLRARLGLRPRWLPGGADPAMIALADELGRDGADRRGIESILARAA